MLSPLVMISSLEGLLALAVQVAAFQVSAAVAGIQPVVLAARPGRKLARTSGLVEMARRQVRRTILAAVEAAQVAQAARLFSVSSTRLRWQLAPGSRATALRAVTADRRLVTVPHRTQPTVAGVVVVRVARPVRC